MELRETRSIRQFNLCNVHDELSAVIYETFTVDSPHY